MCNAAKHIHIKRVFCLNVVTVLLVSVFSIFMHTLISGIFLLLILCAMNTVNVCFWNGIGVNNSYHFVFMVLCEYIIMQVCTVHIKRL